MANILITGSTGFLGGYLSKNLSFNHAITKLSRQGGDLNFNLQKEIPVLNGDFDLVIHAAGKAHQIVLNHNEAKDFFDVNVLGTSNLLSGLYSRTLPKQFVFISTVAVYGKDNGKNLNENTPLLAKDPYGLSKIDAEKLVEDWCMKNGVKCTILRLPLIAGINPPGNLGLLIKAIRSGYYFNINCGKARKSIVLAEDIAKFIVKASYVGGTYNLTDGHHPSFGELSNLIAKQLGKRKPMSLPYSVAKLLALAGDLMGLNAKFNSIKLNKITEDLTFDDSKARIAFGWDPTPVLKGFKIN